MMLKEVADFVCSGVFLLCVLGLLSFLLKRPKAELVEEDNVDI